MKIDLAVSRLNDALDEEYPGEFLDPEALRAVLSELRRLQAIEVRAIVKRDQPMPGTGSWRHPSTVATEVATARYILGEGEG